MSEERSVDVSDEDDEGDQGTLQDGEEDEGDVEEDEEDVEDERYVEVQSLNKWHTSTHYFICLFLVFNVCSEEDDEEDTLTSEVGQHSTICPTPRPIGGVIVTPLSCHSTPLSTQFSQICRFSKCVC